MIVRAVITILIALTMTACAQTKHPGSLSKYEKSVEFVESIITDQSIEDALHEAFLEYKENNSTALLQLPDEALEEINALLTREMINNRVGLISKIAILFTAEFTDDEIVALHSIKDIKLLMAAQKKLQQNSDNNDHKSKLTRAEMDVISNLKNIEAFTTILPKFDALETKIEDTGKAFSEKIIITIFPELLKIIVKYEPLVSASLNL